MQELARLAPAFELDKMSWNDVPQLRAESLTDVLASVATRWPLAAATPPPDAGSMAPTDHLDDGHMERVFAVRGHQEHSQRGQPLTRCIYRARLCPALS